MWHLDDQTLRETLLEFADAGENQTLTAERLGISRSTLQNRLTRAAERGLTTGRTVPAGFAIEGATTLYNGENKVLEWVRTRRERKAIADPIPAIQEAMKDFEGQGLNLESVYPIGTDFERLTVYVLADLHLGMYSWAAETGNDYDIFIADKVFTDAMHDLVQAAPNTETAILLNLGDFFHSDNNENRTLRSGNPLDVDTRYARVMRAGVDLMLQAVHLALQKHDKVIIRNIPGNHDPYGTIALTTALQAYFHGSERVSVDTSPSPFFFYQFGRVLLGAAHGDMAKPNQMVNIMAAKVPQEWGSSDFRYVYMGHIHKKSSGANTDLGGEIGGAIWETFQTLAPKDAWANSMGFVSSRSMQAIVLHKDKGEVMRLTSPVMKQKKENE